jgi:hypothetical protein
MFTFEFGDLFEDFFDKKKETSAKVGPRSKIGKKRSGGWTLTTHTVLRKN